MAVLSAGSLLLVAVPVQADTGPRPLNLPDFSMIVADEAHGHLFFSAGYRGAAVRVTDLLGVHVKTIDGPSGTTGMALTRDGNAVCTD